MPNPEECGVCRKALKENQPTRAMRLTEDDIKNDESFDDKMEPGLYLGCEECVEQHRERVSSRLNIELSEVTNNHLC